MSDRKLLLDVARASQLDEEAEGVRAVLRCVAHEPGISTRALSAKTLIALPTVAAVCAELRKSGVLAPKGGGVRLSGTGEEFVSSTLGIVTTFREAIESSFDEILDTFRHWADKRPEPDRSLDQSKALAESVVRRTLRVYADDGVEGRSICLPGDDDLSSIAIALAHKIISPQRWTVRRLTVLEKDARIIRLIDEAARALGAPVETLKVDLTSPLPRGLTGAFDVVLTDPPYTVPGATLFLSRTAELLEKGPCRRCYLSFGHKPPDETLLLMKAISDLGFVQVEIQPAFNIYEGASIIGSVSQLISLRTTRATRPLISGCFSGPLYTAEVD